MRKNKTDKPYIAVIVDSRGKPIKHKFCRNRVEALDYVVKNGGLASKYGSGYVRPDDPNDSKQYSTI